MYVKRADDSPARPFSSVLGSPLCIGTFAHRIQLRSTHPKHFCIGAFHVHGHRTSTTRGRADRPKKLHLSYFKESNNLKFD